MPAKKPDSPGDRIPLFGDALGKLEQAAEENAPGARARLREEEKFRDRWIKRVAEDRQAVKQPAPELAPEPIEISPRDRFRAAFARTPQPAIATGIAGLDVLLDDGGLPSGEVTVYTADIAMGKTALAARLAASPAVPRVWYLAAEPSEDEIYARIGSPLIGVPYGEVRRWGLERAEKELYPAIEEISSRLEISRNLQGFELLEQRVAAGFNFAGWLIIGDYVQKFGRQLRGDRRAAVGRVMDALHGAARLGACVLALSQINRDAARKGQDVHSAAESADIERDAALLIGASRVGRWGKDRHVTIRLTVLKQRFAPGDLSADVTFDLALGSFSTTEQQSAAPRELAAPPKQLADKIRAAWGSGLASNVGVARAVGGKRQVVIDAIRYLRQRGEGPGTPPGNTLFREHPCSQPGTPRE